LNQKKKGRGPDVFLGENLYDSTRYKGGGEDERRVYYVALTRAEKYLFLSGMRDDPTVENERQPADFIGELRQDLLHEPEPLVLKKSGLAERKRDLHDFSTTFSELSAYGRCGYDYKLRHVYGYNAGVPVAFGYGTQIHNILNIIHQKYRDKPLSPDQIEQLIKKHFYLRYAPGNINEAMQKAATRVVQNYVAGHSAEFKNVLETEKSFEFTLGNSLVNGQIDLIKRLDDSGELQEVELVDFKSDHSLVYKTDFEHQLRLYVMASLESLGLKPKRAVVHDLEYGQKKDVDIAAEKLQETRALLSGRVDGIRGGQFTPTSKKEVCSGCDYSRICVHCQH
jgi:DNA helicase-2/ATP-dependent DNA helicase PcrA